MPKPDYHVFVCGQTRPEGHPRGSCGVRGSNNLFRDLSRLVFAKKLQGKVSIVQSTCLGPCSTGANVLVFPGAHLYANLSADDVEKIVDQHFVGGAPVTEKLAGDEVW